MGWIGPIDRWSIVRLELKRLIVGFPASLAVGESKWDASQISELFQSMLQPCNKIRQPKLCNILGSLYKYTMKES